MSGKRPDAGWRAPMLATLTDDRFDDPAWLFERKLDGVRAIVARDHGGTTLWSRNQKSMDATYPELVTELDRRGPDRFVADGEIVAFDGPQTSFSKLQGRIQLRTTEDIEKVRIPVYLYLFDLLVLDDQDVPGGRCANGNGCCARHSSSAAHCGCRPPATKPAPSTSGTPANAAGKD